MTFNALHRFELAPDHIISDTVRFEWMPNDFFEHRRYPQPDQAFHYSSAFRSVVVRSGTPLSLSDDIRKS